MPGAIWQLFLNGETYLKPSVHWATRYILYTIRKIKKTKNLFEGLAKTAVINDASSGETVTVWEELT